MDRWSVPGVGLLTGASSESLLKDRRTELGPTQAICCSGALGPGTFLRAGDVFSVTVLGGHQVLLVCGG